MHDISLAGFSFAVFIIGQIEEGGAELVYLKGLGFRV